MNLNMDKPKLIAKLNQAISLELGALLQYNQYSKVLLGHERRVWKDFFEDSSDESLKHARKFAERVVALSGVPSVEPEAVKQTGDLAEMLANSLELERRAVEVYTEALQYVGESVAYRNLLEEQVETETEDVEELEKYLNLVSKTPVAAPHAKRMGKAG
ncbi:MAG: ferritin-like domain-containing protein [Tepidisphaeraceae bacterium]